MTDHVMNPNTIDAIRKELEAITEYRAVHGEASVSPTFRRLADPVAELLDHYLALVDRADALERALRSADQWLEQIEHAPVDQPISLDGNRAAAARHVIRQMLTTT